jgi:hypothetical protein
MLTKFTTSESRVKKSEVLEPQTDAKEGVKCYVHSVPAAQFSYLINLKNAFINIFYCEPHEFRDAQSGHVWGTDVIREIENQ